MHCPSCKTDLLAGGRFCPQCGTELLQACPVCGCAARAVSNFCSDCGAVLRNDPAGASCARQQRAFVYTNADAEHRHLSIMFCDIVDSVALTEGSDLEQLRDLLTAYQRQATAVVETTGGLIARYQGDGILAYFGYPLANEDDAERVIRAALRLIKEIENSPTLTQSLRLRVGIATGMVVVGELVASAAADRPPIIGGAANLAARLQSIAEPNSVVIDANTKRLAGDLFEYASLGLRHLKGFSQPMQAWRVLGESTVGSRFEALRAGSAPLVDREAELALLQRAWERARVGEGQVVVVKGEAGIGKSRLISAFSELFTRGHTKVVAAGAWPDKTPVVIAFHASPNHTNTALYPITRQLERLAAFEWDDADAVKRKKLAAFLKRCGSGGGSEVIALLSDLLAIAPETRQSMPDQTPRAKRQRTFEALQAWVAGIASCQPLLLVVEDLQWIDPSTHVVLDRLVTWSATARVMIIATERTGLFDGDSSRPGSAPAQITWLDNPHVAVCELSELCDEASLQLISLTAREKALPSVLVEAVLEKSDGIPLYIEELTRGLIDTEVIEARHDYYVLKAEPASLTLPNSLRGSLMARLDRVGLAKEVAQHAAVIGREFSVSLLAKLSPLPRDRLYDGIKSLVSANIIRGDGAARDPVYQFKHALIQDAAYHSLLRRRRRELHLSFAERLEAEKSYLPGVTDDLIGTHYARAGAPRQAIAAWRRAARTAFHVSAQHEAANLLRLALRRLAELPDDRERLILELELTMELASALGTVSGYAAPEAESQYARARELCVELGEKSVRFNVEFGLMFSVFVKGDLERASGIAKELFEHAEYHPNQPYVDAFLANGMIRMHQGRLEESRDLLQRGIALADPERDQPHLFTHGQNPGVFCCCYLAWVLALMGKWREAIAMADGNLILARRRAGDPSHTYSYAVALAFACRVNLILRDKATVNQLSGELMDVARRHHYGYLELVGKTLHGWALASECSPTSLRHGAQEMCDGLEAMERTGTGLGLRGFYVQLAEIQIQLGNKADALAALEKAVRSMTSGSRAWDAEIERVRGEALKMAPQADPLDAQQRLHSALAIARGQGARTFELRAAVSYARLLLEGDRRRRGEALDMLLAYMPIEEPQIRDAADALALIRELTATRP
jgi:class 3 adenylate cyclase/tetratricopeptide (TPR) repeat protein